MTAREIWDIWRYQFLSCTQMGLIKRSTGVIGLQTINCGSNSPIVLISEVVLEHSHTHSFMHGLWLFSQWNSRVTSSRQTLQRPIITKPDVLSGPLEKMFTNSCFIQGQQICPLLPTTTFRLLSNDCLFSEYTLHWFVYVLAQLFLPPRMLFPFKNSCVKSAYPLRCDSNNTSSMKFYNKKKIKFQGRSSLPSLNIFATAPASLFLVLAWHTQLWFRPVFYLF